MEMSQQALPAVALGELMSTLNQAIEHGVIRAPATLRSGK
jgi:hypothetical protein